MYKSTLFGEYLVEYCRNRKIEINHTKLQKLLYIIYGSYFAICGKALLDEPPVAWAYGPIFVGVRQHLVKNLDYKSKPDTSNPYNIITQNNNLMLLLDNCMEHFSAWSSSQLVEWSCREGSPWASSVVSNSLAFGSRINDTLIKSYFTRLLKSIKPTNSAPQNSAKLPHKTPATEFNPDIYTLEQQKNRRYGQDTSHRHTLIVWVMIIIPVWLAVVLLIVTFTEIDPSVKIALLGTTTINVLGLPLIVLRGLFGDDHTK